MKSKIYVFIGLILVSCLSFWLGYIWQNNCNSQIETEETNKLFLPIYSTDINTYKEIILDSIIISKELPLEENLKSLCSQLSSKSFFNKPIIIDSLITINNKKVIYVNLLESIGKKTWKGHMFQGSAGGFQTSFILRESILQKDYEGEWIDGLLVSYEGEPISKDIWDHMGGLHLYQWRDST